MADPVLATAISALVASVASVVVQYRQRKLPALAEGATAMTVGQQAVVYDRDVEALRTEVASLRGENGALRYLVNEVKVELAKTNGEIKMVSGVALEVSREMHDILGRERVEAEARGVLRSRVEFLVGLLQGDGPGPGA